VLRDFDNGGYVCYDELYCGALPLVTELKTVFKDGKITKFYDFMDIRRRIYG
jgi:hypothetical protein